MIGVRQTRTGSVGNCFAACLASILETRLPEFGLPENPDYDANVDRFLAKRGLRYSQVPIDENAPVGWHTIEGISPRGGMHAIVGFNGKPKWDPHPMDGTKHGLVKPMRYGLLTPTAKDRVTVSPVDGALKYTAKDSILDRYSMRDLLDAMGIDIKEYMRRTEKQKDALLRTAIAELDKRRTMDAVKVGDKITQTTPAKNLLGEEELRVATTTGEVLPVKIAKDARQFAVGDKVLYGNRPCTVVANLKSTPGKVSLNTKDGYTINADIDKCAPMPMPQAKDGWAETYAAARKKSGQLRPVPLAPYDHKAAEEIERKAKDGVAAAVKLDQRLDSLRDKISQAKANGDRAKASALKVKFNELYKQQTAMMKTQKAYDSFAPGAHVVIQAGWGGKGGMAGQDFKRFDNDTSAVVTDVVGGDVYVKPEGSQYKWKVRAAALVEGTPGRATDGVLKCPKCGGDVEDAQNGKAFCGTCNATVKPTIVRPNNVWGPTKAKDAARRARLHRALDRVLGKDVDWAQTPHAYVSDPRFQGVCKYCTMPQGYKVHTKQGA